MMRWTDEQLAEYAARNTRQTSHVAAVTHLVVPDKQGIGVTPAKGVKGLKCATEDAEQLALARYLDFIGVKWAHVPNGGNRNVITAKKLKGHGVKKGVPDVLIFQSPPLVPYAKGIAIELKRVKGGTVSAEQKEWLEHLENQGWCCCVAKGAGEAVKFLKELGF